MERLSWHTDTQSEVPLELFIHTANAMNRHLVLPVFPCENRGRAETFCNLCGHQPFRCHLSLIRRATLPVKEHMFFYNKHVPEVVKRDFRNAPTIYLKRVEGDCRLVLAEFTGNIRCLEINAKPLMHTQLVEKLESLESLKDERVIRIHSISMNFFQLSI